MKVGQELALLRAEPGEERAKLLREPPRLPNRAQAAVLARLAESSGRLAAEAVPYRLGLLLTARRWLRLARVGRELCFELTEAGRDVLAHRHRLPPVD